MCVRSATFEHIKTHFILLLLEKKVVSLNIMNIRLFEIHRRSHMFSCVHQPDGVASARQVARSRHRERRTRQITFKLNLF